MDDRGQPIQVGAILLFGFLVIAFSIFQAVVVPQQNEEVEFDHNREVQYQMAELRQSVLRAASTGHGYPVSVQLGTTYPPRVIAVNPGPSSGSLRNVALDGGDSLVISNAAALDEETGDFWGGSDRTYATGGIVYEPNYNVFQQAPATVYENSVVYNRAPDGAVVTQTDQRLVDGRTLDLTVLQGEYQRSGSDTVSVDVSSPTAAPRTVLVRGSDDPIRITVPTNLPLSAWEQLLDDQLEENGGYIRDLSKSSDGTLQMTLMQTDSEDDLITYELRLPATGIGTGVPEPTTAYITDVSGNGTTISRGGSQQVVAEVRNEFSAPEPGVKTCAEATDGSVDPSTAISDENGRVSYIYDISSNSSDTVHLAVSYDCNGDTPDPDASPETKVNFTIHVSSPGAGPGNGGPP